MADDTGMTGHACGWFLSGRVKESLVFLKKNFDYRLDDGLEAGRGIGGEMARARLEMKRGIFQDV